MEGNRDLRVAVSGTSIPLRNAMVWRENFEKGTPIQISKSSSTASPSDAPPPVAESLAQIERTLDRSFSSDGLPKDILEQMQRVGREEKLQVACADTSAALKKFKSLLVYQKGRIFSPRSIELKLATGKPEKTFLHDLVDLMKDFPPLEDQTIQITWNNPNGEIKAHMQDGEFHANISEAIGDGMSILSVVLQRNGQKSEFSHYHSLKRPLHQ